MAANTLTNLIPTLYEARDIVSRELHGMIPAVTRNTSATRAALNETILVPIAPQVALVDNVPNVTAPNAPGQIIGNVPMMITKSRSAQIPWTGEEQLGVSNNGTFNQILANQLAQGFRSLTNEMEADLVKAAIAGASRAYGTAGTAPFGIANDLSDIAGVRRILDDNGAPQNDLKLVVGGATMQNLRGKQSVLFKVNESGTEELLREGVIGRLEGMNIHNSGQIGVVAKGSAAGAWTTNASGYAIGATSITVGGGTGVFNPGDSITFAGDTNRYIVTSFALNVITLGGSGLLQAIPAAATAITVGGNFTPNLAFSKSAIQFIARKPAMPIGPDGKAADMADDTMEITDAKSGITFEIALYRQFLQMVFHVRAAWGVAAIKSAHTAILLG